MRFRGKVGIVTGAGSGIGRAVAERLASEGALVAVVDRDQAGGEETVTRIRGQKGEARFFRADVGRGEEIRSCVRGVVEAWGAVHVLVNNAAMMRFHPVAEIPDEEWDLVLGVNLRSVFLFTKYCLPHMREGAIVNVSSVHAHENTANCASYAASKGGIEAFTRALSRELDGKRLRVNSVAPGAVNTPMLWNNPNVKAGRERVSGAVGQPGDLAAAICFLASSDAAFIHGTTLVVDGGRLDIL